MPKCLCGKEMQFVMNNSGLQLYKCSCGRVMLRARNVPDMRAYYQLVNVVKYINERKWKSRPGRKIRSTRLNVRARP